MSHPRNVVARLAGSLALLAASLAPLVGASAQTTSTFTACTPGALVNCAEFRLTETPGAGAGGGTLFEVAIRNMGVTGNAGLPTSIYNFIFGTGAPPATPGEEVSVAVSPTSLGGATLTDATAWDVFESGDAIFFSSPTNMGVGGCATGAPVEGFGQAGNTCGADQLLAFVFSTSRIFDLTGFTLLNLEVVGVAQGLPAASCGSAELPCAITFPGDVSVVPEPATTVLVASGLLGMLGFRRRGTRPPAEG